MITIQITPISIPNNQMCAKRKKGILEYINKAHGSVVLGIRQVNERSLE